MNRFLWNECVSCIIFIFMLTQVLVSCTDSMDVLILNPQEMITRTEELCDSNYRIKFNSENMLSSFLEAYGDYDNEEDLATLRSNLMSNNPQFVSLLNKRGSTNSETDLTYYEIMGYDTLVPNPVFAMLLNSKGEVEVRNRIVKVTPNGTYLIDKAKEAEFDKIYRINDDVAIGRPIDSIRNYVIDGVILYRTFDDKNIGFTLIDEGDLTEIPEPVSEDLELNSNIGDASINSDKSTEPDFNSFAQFSADHHSWIGKLIQSIIGSTKTHTVYFNSKRRLKGSFYFYNYGVYSEIGVKGWTDKKKLLWWNKTTADEIRIGWSHVVLKSTYPDYFKSMMQSINSVAYQSPKSVNINGTSYNAATLIMPELKASLKERIVASGVKAIYDYIKSECQKPSDMEKAEAFLVATRTEVYFVAAPKTISKKNVKSNTHIFHSQWMDFQIGWSNNGGFFIGNNSVNQNNVTEIGPWIKTAIDVFNQRKTKLIGGEVFVCAKLGQAWKGMRIIKKLPNDEK